MSRVYVQCPYCGSDVAPPNGLMPDVVRCHDCQQDFDPSTIRRAATKGTVIAGPAIPKKVPPPATAPAPALSPFETAVLAKLDNINGNLAWILFWIAVPTAIVILLAGLFGRR